MRVLARVEFGEDEQACEFRARPDLQLAEKVQTVGLDGTLADAEAGRRIAIPMSSEPDDRAFMVELAGLVAVL